MSDPASKTTARKPRWHGMSRNLSSTRRTRPTLEQVRIAIASKMVEVAALFVPEVTVTVLVRYPGDDRADICITDDEFPDLQAMLARCRARHEGTSDAD